MGELYGEFDELTQEWTDGLASHFIRQAVVGTAESADLRWTVFDGPVDALWIENMNTVLDDNMTLCLANAERIKLNLQMRMLFEVMDLAAASPATVSRCGMVFVSEVGGPPVAGAAPGLPSHPTMHPHHSHPLFTLTPRRRPSAGDRPSSLGRRPPSRRSAGTRHRSVREPDEPDEPDAEP